MKAYRLLCGFCFLMLAQPMLSHAEIYKWIENGTVRYSDMPPPSNIKTEKIIKKKETKKTEAAAKDALATAISKAQPADADKKKISAPEQQDKDMEAARLRQKQAEADKNKKQQEESQAKAREQNCISARSNYETYKQGGRIAQINENGEKSYMGDSDIKAGLEKAQADMNQYCS